jgi:hypothetical protein
MRLLRTESMTATAAPPTTARSHFFDNAKLILIAIVAIGHFVEPFAYTRTSTTLSALWFSIYLFHMRPFQTTKWLRNVVLYVALVLAIFLDTRYLMGQKGFTLSFFRQGGLPWYLLAIVIYPIVMVALKQIRPVPLLAGSVVLALLAGLDNSINDTLALSRVIVYAPFYIAGYYLPIAATERFVRTTKIKYAALALSAVTIVVVFTQLHRLRPYMPLLSARRGYESAGVSDTTGLIARHHPGTSGRSGLHHAGVHARPDLSVPGCRRADAPDLRLALLRPRLPGPPWGPRVAAAPSADLVDPALARAGSGDRRGRLLATVELDRLVERPIELQAADGTGPDRLTSAEPVRPR